MDDFPRKPPFSSRIFPRLRHRRVDTFSIDLALAGHQLFLPPWCHFSTAKWLHVKGNQNHWLMFSHMFGFFWKHQIVCSWFMAALSDSQCVALKWDWSAASAFLPCLNSPALYTLELKPLHIVFCAYRAPWMIHRVMIWWLCLLLWLRLMRQRGFPPFFGGIVWKPAEY